MEVLADVQPWRARVYEDAHYVLLQGGSLGSMPSTDEAVNVREALRALEPVTPETKDTTLRVTKVSRDESKENQQRSIWFEQVISDLSVDRRNQLHVGSDGRITEIEISIVGPGVSVLKPMISEGLALVRAREALARKLSNGRPIESILPPELKYQFVKGATLAPMYRFGFSTDSGQDYWVQLDANSGATKIDPIGTARVR
jgi:hypothetical protein